MTKVGKYPEPQNEHESSGLSTKQWIGIGVGAAVILGLGIRTIIKVMDKSKTNNAEAKSFTDGTAETIAKQIKMAFENDGNFGTDTKKLRGIMTSLKSKDQWQQIADQYKLLYKIPLANALYSELQSSEYDEMMAIKDSKPQKQGQKVPGDILYDCWAKRLKAAFDKTYSFVSGTDEPAIMAVFNEVPTQRAFINVGKAYGKRYHANVMEVLKTELEFWEYDDYMKIILKKPQA